MSVVHKPLRAFRLNRTQLNVNVTPESRKALHKIARLSRRPLAATVREALDQYVAANLPQRAVKGGGR